MIDTQHFEALLECMNGEIEALDELSVKHNLTDIYDALYGIFEDILTLEPETLSEENRIMKMLLADRLTYDEKQYFKRKYDLDVGVGHGWTL